MKPDDLKNSIHSVEPDGYMETRIFAEVANAEKPKKKNRKMLKAAVCTALCCAVLAAGIGIGIPNKVISNNSVVSDVDYGENYFIMSVCAAENEKETATPIDDHTVILPDYKLEKNFFSEGLELRGSSDRMGFDISGKNIKTVKAKCERGTFNIWNFDLLNYLRDNGMYYDVIVPYSNEYETSGTDTRLDIMFKHIKNGDYDEYIKDIKIKSYDDYVSADVVYDKDDNKIGIGLVSKENFSKVNPNGNFGDLKEYTFENVLNKTEHIGDCFLWRPNVAEILDNPDMSFAELPHDIISLEVTFNDNSVQYASYDFSFNENGELIIDRIAD